MSQRSVRSRSPGPCEESPASQRQRLSDNPTEDPGAAHDDEDEWFGGNYLSQTDNPNTPLGLGSSNGGGPKLKHEKSIQDRVHGQITLHGLLVAVMDTAEFQRLDRVKQLGGCAYVYPSATHTRKEHSIGVAFLAGMMAKHLAKQQPALDIDEHDILCVELAGLVHDLGHGPFSHMFEDFMERVRAPGEEKWEHEVMSGKLLYLLLEENQIPVAQYFDCTPHMAEAHMRFVVHLVNGLKDEAPWPDDIGRGAEKRFLFDIVNNKRCGVDVDKLDYLVRDSMAAFGSSSKVPGFDIYRIVQSSRVLYREHDIQQPEVCFQVKNALEILEIHGLRAKLHRQVYQHRIANVAEAMITDVFLAAKEAFSMKGVDGKQVRISEAARDPRSFVRLTDAILDAIDMAPAKGLEAAGDLLERLKRRDFYRQVGQPVNIETLPLCGKPSCRKPTQIDASHCPNCGKDTRLRDGKTLPGASDAAFRSSGVELSVAMVKKELLARLPGSTRSKIEDEDALFVHIVDVQNGKRTTRKDPWGLTWAVHDPLARVGFFNPKEVDTSGNPSEKIKHLDQGKFPQLYLPASTHTRTLWCYLKTEGEPSRHWRRDVEAALDEWQKERLFTQQTGTSNSASPAMRHRAAQTPTDSARASKSSLKVVASLNGRLSTNRGGRELSSIPEAGNGSASRAN